MEFETKSVVCAHPGGTHKMTYYEWNPCGSPTVVCVHGLTRTGRDFDLLAKALVAKGLRCVCPDIVGRGQSDWLPENAFANYSYPQYASDLFVLIARLNVEKVIWIGTSMGGLLGMDIASRSNIISKFVINDIGPKVTREGLLRIKTYVGNHVEFDSFAAGEAHLRKMLVAFGPHTDEQFRYLTQHYLVERESKWTFHYDLNIVKLFKELDDSLIQDMNLWAQFDKMQCPLMIVRGANSDLLDQATFEEMKQRHTAPVHGVEFEGVGHAPTFLSSEQIEPVVAFVTSKE